MTLAQLKVFVLVSRLGSVRAAAAALGVSEPAVSQALAALRQHLDDPLITRRRIGDGTHPRRSTGRVDRLADGQPRCRGRSSRAPIERRRRTAPGRHHQHACRTRSCPALLQAFTARAGGIEVNLGVATTDEMEALVQERLADVAIGPQLAGVETRRR